MQRLRGLDIQFVKGIGPTKAALLASELGIRTAADLVRHYPTHYVDRSKIYRIADLATETDPDNLPALQLRGSFVSFVEQGEGAKRRLVGLFADGSGATIEAVWFRGLAQVRRLYHVGMTYTMFGKPTRFGKGYNARWSMAHPEVDPEASAGAKQGLRGIYPLTEKLRNRGISARVIHQWIQAILNPDGHPRKIDETLPANILAQYKLMGLAEALAAVHNPPDMATAQQARLRLKFEELFYLQVDLRRTLRTRKDASQGAVFAHVGTFFNRFYNECLPFALTGAQKRVMHQIRADVVTGRQMNRLVQGDVGSGKTIVALMAMLLAIDNGAQAALMAPTEILAQQHYENLRAMVAPIGINVQLLTGSTRTAARREIHAGLRDGSVQLLVGTHALVEDTVQWRNLGLAVIDEQHRFGVAQRGKLWAKNNPPPHILVMTATPIPRTLAMTVYGDLDVSVIDELPPGRKPITTVLRYEPQRMQVMRGLGAQLRQGRQAYIVYPLIDENDKLGLLSLTQGYEEIRDTFRDYNVAFVHGRLKPDEKEHQMQLFASGKAQILVATTVIEVGVNVPNATVMIIEGAERFGLSQLHQLRGRVGRGGDQSYCILMSKYKIAADTRKRLELMTRTTDGFVIAEADMAMRGPGDIEGTQQSGIPMRLRIANMATDGQIIQMARDAAETLLDDDPTLSAAKNAPFAAALLAERTTVGWSRIS